MAASDQLGPSSALVNIGVHGDTATVVLGGDLDMASGHAITSICAELATHVDRIEVDLSGVTFIDSGGLHVLLDVRRLANDRNATFAVIASTERARRLFELTGTDHLFIDGGAVAPEARHGR